MTTNKWKQTRALIIKEFHQITRDPSSLLIAVIFPFILLFIYAVGVSLDMEHLKVGLVLQDTGSDAQSFYLSLKNSRFFDVHIARHKDQLEEQMTAGILHGLITVPFYFSQYQKRSATKGPIYVVADGSDPNTAHFVQNYTLGAWTNWLAQQNISEKENDNFAVHVQQRFWYNEDLNSRYFLLPGAIAIIMTLIGSLLTALVIAREWERGTIEALMAMPISMQQIYIAKIISYFLMGLASMAICTFLSIVVFGIPFRGSYLLLIAVSSIFLLTSLGTGLLISSATRNQFLSAQMAIIISFLPAFMLSGFIFEISSMPLIIRLITYIIPARYMVSSMKTLFLAGNIYELIFIDIAIMTLISAILFSIIFATTKKRLD